MKLRVIFKTALKLGHYYAKALQDKLHDLSELTQFIMPGIKGEGKERGLASPSWFDEFGAGQCNHLNVL